jgi:hypothetical protein
MALNTNIALGVQPIQQPNMLAQYGQMMALKAAQQETQGNEALRAAYASGGDLSDPEFRRKIMAANPKLGSQLVNQFSEMSARDVKTQAESLKAIKDSIGVVNSPAEMVDFLKGAYSTPGGALLTKLAPFDRAVANIPQDPKSFEEYKRKFSLSADKLFTSAADELAAKTRIQAANIGAGATMRGQDLLDKRERERLDYLQGENGFYGVNRFNPNSARPVGMAPEPGAPRPPVAQPSAVNNMLITPGVAQPSVNALTQPSPNQAGPTVAAANALANQPTIIRPKQPVRQPVAVMKDGKAVLVPPQEAVGMQPASPDAEKAARLQAQQVRDLDITIKNLSDITKEGGLISQSTGSGIGRAYDVAAGFVGNAPEGAIAAAKLAPIADMVLKMVPRFEGPQSDKDTQSYKEAAGQLANPNLPTKIRQEAGKEILRLMKERKNQFVSTDMAREGFGATTGGSSGGAPADPLGIR